MDSAIVYEWKIPSLYPVDAQLAGEELERIKNKYGDINAKNVVEESRRSGAVLHDCFEWRDDIAAEKYRETQAKAIIRSITYRVEEVKREPVRAFFHTKTAQYQPAVIVFRTTDMYEELRLSAIRDMEIFKKKYEIIDELNPVFSEFDKAVRRMEANKKTKPEQRAAV